jgi:hypothetical protein
MAVDTNVSIDERLVGVMLYLALTSQPEKQAFLRGKCVEMSHNWYHPIQLIH